MVTLIETDAKPHRLVAHTLVPVAFLGAGMLCFGLATLGLAFRFSATTWIPVYLLEFFFVLLYGGSAFVRCPCKKVALPNPYWKHIKLRGNRDRRALIFPGLFILASIAFLPTSITYLFHVNSLIMLGGGFTLFGITSLAGAPLIARAMTKIPVFPLLIPESELGKISRLTGETAEDLRNLIDFYLKTGDFDNAEICSRKLLELSEKSK